MIKCELDKMNLEISQSYLIKKLIQGFNNDVKSRMTFNNPVTQHKGIVRKQEIGTKISKCL